MFDDAISYLLEHPWLLIIQLIISVCVATGLYTRNRIFRAANKALGTKPIPHTAHWLPWISNAYAPWLKSKTSLDVKSRACQSPVFATHIWGRDYIVLTDGSSFGSLLRDGKVKPIQPDADSISRRFFGNPHVTAAKAVRKRHMKQIYHDDAKKLDTVASLLNTNAYNLISPATSWVDQAQWERTSGARLVESESTLTVSASLNILVRDFSAYILLCPLLGRSFLEANPDFVGDMFYFGSSYSAFMRGLPYWIMPGLGPPAFAREKCLRALDGLVRAITAEQTGQSVAGLGDAVLYDVEEVHESILYAIKQAREEDEEKPGVRTVSSELLEFVFEMTHFYVLEVLWTIIYVTKWEQKPANDMQTIDKEIKQFVKVVKPPPSGLPYEDPPQLKFNNLAQLKLGTEAACPALSSIVDRMIKHEAQPLAKFSVLADTQLEVELASGGKSKAVFEVKKGDHVLFGVKYAAPGNLAGLGKNGRLQTLDTDCETCVWMVSAVILSMYNFDKDNTPAFWTSSESSPGFNSIVEPSALQVSITRRPID